MTTLSLHLFMRSSQAESIIAAVSWLALRRRQVATCPQLGSTNRLEYTQVRPGTHSFTAKSATLAGRCRPGSVQSLRPGVQMSAWRWLLSVLSYLSNYCQPVFGISGRRSPPAIVWPWSSRFSTSHVWNLLRKDDVHLRTPALQTLRNDLLCRVGR